MAEIDEIISKKAINDLFDADKGITQLDTATLKFIETVERLNSSLRENGISLKQVEGAQKQSDAAAKEAVRLAKEQEAAAKALDKQRQAGLAAMAKQEAKERELTAAINKEIKSEQDMIDKMAALTKARKQLDTTTAQGRVEHAKYTAEILHLNNTLKKSDEAIGNHQRKVGNYENALKGLRGTLEQVFPGFSGLMNMAEGLTNSMSDLVSGSQKTADTVATVAPVMEATAEATQAVAPAMATAGTATQSFGAKLWALVKNPIVITIAAVVGALAALYAAFKSTDDGATRLEAIWASMGATIDVLHRRTVQLIDGFGKLFSGDFKGAADDLGGAFSGMGADLSNASGAAWDFVYAMDALEARQVAFISEEANARLEIAKLNVAYRDSTKTVEERQAILEQMLELEKNIATKKQEFAQKEYENNINNVAGLLNVSAAMLDNFIKMDSDAQIALAEANPAFARIWNLRKDKGIKQLEEMYAGMKDAETAYFDETVRAQTKLSGFKAEQLKDEEEANKTANENYLKAHEKREKVEQDRINMLREMDKTRVEFVRANEEKILEIKKKAAEAWAEVFANEEEIRDEEDPLVIRMTDRLSALTQFAQQQYEINQQSYDKDIEALDIALANKLIKEEEYDAAVTELNKKRAAEIVGITNQLGDAVFDIWDKSLSAQEDRNKQEKEFELKMAGDNAAAKIRIEEKYNEKDKDLKRKQAERDKMKSLFEIIIGTATAIIEAAPVVPLMIAMGVIGAIQAGIVASQPIPQFYTGTQNAPSGLISLGERGRELVETKSGQLLMANSPTLATGLGGAKIYSNMETERLLRAKNERGQSIDISELATNQRTTNRLLKKLAVSHNGNLIYLNDDKIIKSV